MSDKPFALSTVPPARPAQDDYDSICATVMASARGRRFLAEYARRNRNADTRLVLGAIERIEALIRGERGRQAHPGARIDPLQMAKAIAERRAEAAAIEAPETPGRVAQDPAPHSCDVVTMAERLQDAAWTMRERGLAPTTCDQIEALAAAILSSSSLRDLAEVLQYLERRINGMLDGAATASEPGEALSANRAREAGNGHAAGVTTALGGAMAGPTTFAASSPAASVRAMPAPDVRAELQREPRSGSPTAAEMSGSESAPIVDDAALDPDGNASGPPSVPVERSASEPGQPVVSPSTVEASAEPAAVRSADLTDVRPESPPEPLAATAAPPQLEPMPATEPRRPPADVMNEIEAELFSPVPVDDTVDSLAAPQVDATRSQQPVTQSATAAVPPAAATAAPAPEPPAASNALAALKAMSDEERIALFT
jgi:hypothetical protein